MNPNYFKLLAFALVCLLPLSCVQFQEAGNQSYPQFSSPEIMDDNSVTFQVYSPDANTVTISGSWMEPGGRTNLAKGHNDIWSITMEPLSPNMYHYHFFIDGVSTLDEKNPHTLRDGGRFANLLMIPGEASEIYQINDIPHGTLSKVWYDSPSLEMQRRMYLYTPPGYETSNEQYPVLYLLHGAGGDEDAWTTLGRTNYILDNLIAGGTAQPMIVVMPNGNAWQTSTMRVNTNTKRPRINTYTKERSQFEESLVEDIIPFVEKNYRAKSGKDYRALAGLSMGGDQTIHASLDYPDTFGYLGVFSAGISAPNRKMEAKFNKLKGSGLKKYWVACGKYDFLMEDNLELLKLLDKTGITYEYYESEGGHDWASWRNHLSKFAPILFQ